MEQDDIGHEDCAFCLGRAAAHRGEAEGANPYSHEDVEVGSSEWYDTDFALWEMGHGLGTKEPGGVPWYAADGASSDEEGTG